jgi:2-polyprenyl-3-methyl-5-hydroxy-6-metoxy-1,4-benzoquinol methylase
MAGLESTRRFKSRSQTVISYADARYWDTRYSEKGSDPKQDLSFAPFEWYLRYEQLKEVLQPILVEATPPPPPTTAGEDQEATDSQEQASPKPQILVLGCGTSTLSEDLYNEGYLDITNVDRCQALIDHLSAKHEAKETLRYESQDVRCLPQEWNSKFDVVIDKACLDAIACGKDARQDVPAALSAISRVLKPMTGIYISISHAAAEIRQPMLSGANDTKVIVSKKNRWQVSCNALPRLLAPPPEAGAKGGAAPKGGAVELKPSPAFRANEHVYNMYVCRRPPLLVDDAAGWFDFWASPDMALTCDTLARSLIKSLYIPEAERSSLRSTVARMWADRYGDVERIEKDVFINLADALRANFVTPPQA